MRYILGLACLLAFVTMNARAEAADPPPLYVPDPPALVQRIDRMEERFEARFDRIEKMLAGKTASGVAAPAPFDLSPCPDGKCSLQPGAVQYQGQVTTVRCADGKRCSLVQDDTLSSVPVQYGARTYTLTDTTGGITSSGCANGRCGSSSSGYAQSDGWYLGKNLGRSRR